MVCGKTAWAKKQSMAPTNCATMCTSCVQTPSTLKGLSIQGFEQPAPMAAQTWPTSQSKQSARLASDLLQCSLQGCLRIVSRDGNTLGPPRGWQK